MNTESQTAKIRDQNDRFRATGRGGRFLITRGVQALGEVAVADIMEKVRTFDKFTEDNDPYHEHDFGKIVHHETTIFWKIDYYDMSLEFGSPNPADLTVTERVLTVMLADEY